MTTTNQGEIRPEITHTPTTPSNGIYCPLATDGLLNDDVGISALSALPALLVLDETVKRSKNYMPVYQTDYMGMRRALCVAYEIQGTVHRTLRTVGLLAANIGEKDLAEADAAGVGWLMCALGELAEVVDGAAHGIAMAVADGRYLGGKGGEDCNG